MHKKAVKRFYTLKRNTMQKHLRLLSNVSLLIQTFRTI